MTSLPQSLPRGPKTPLACNYPMRMEPRFVERVWGSENLAPLYAARPATQSRIGEVWLTGDENVVSNGPHAGRSLASLAQDCGRALLGTRSRLVHPSGIPVFPLLVKFLFTTDKLSVQAHPPDSYAAAMSSWGKTEMWHITGAEPGAMLAVGFQRAAAAKLQRDPAAFDEAVRSGAIEQMLDWREARRGETFFVPAGTVHAIGAGLSICEIQQNSDITFRLFDYHRPGTDGKPRPLHVAQAREILAWETAGGLTAPVEASPAPRRRLCLAACPYFSTERWETASPWRHATAGRMEIWIGLEGRMTFSTERHEVPCAAGEAVILPADLPSVNVQPHGPSAFLRTFVPDVDRDVLALLHDCHAGRERVRLVYFPMTTP